MHLTCSLRAACLMLRAQNDAEGGDTTTRAGGKGTMGPRTRVMLSHASGHLQLPAAGREESSLHPSDRASPLDALILCFWPPGRIVLCCLKPPSRGGNLLQKAGLAEEHTPPSQGPQHERRGFVSAPYATGVSCACPQVCVVSPEPSLGLRLGTAAGHLPELQKARNPVGNAVTPFWEGCGPRNQERSGTVLLGEIHP